MPPPGKRERTTAALPLLDGGEAAPPLGGALEGAPGGERSRGAPLPALGLLFLGSVRPVCLPHVPPLRLQPPRAFLLGKHC